MRAIKVCARGIPVLALAIVWVAASTNSEANVCEDGEFELNVSYENICQGERIKASWNSQKYTSIKIYTESGRSVEGDPTGLPSEVGPKGETNILLQQTETIVAESPDGKCNAEKTVEVIIPGDLRMLTEEAGWVKDPLAFTGPMKGWALQFKVHDWQVSPRLQAQGISARLASVNSEVLLADGTHCKTPPLFKGEYVTGGYGFVIKEPRITTGFSIKFHPAGTWKFEFVAKCPAGKDYIPSLISKVPFGLNLICKK